jgi:pimeloyl-ACP methyl ester carboxylesterase
MMRAYADTPEGQIHYQTEGGGEPLLLIHQMPLSSDEYSKVMPLLAKYFWVLAMDNPGYGKSDPPPNEHPLIGDYAKSVANFLAALGISKTNIYGHHTGAAIASEVAASYPALVDRLILSGCPYYTPEMREERINNPIYYPLKVEEDGSHLMKFWQAYSSTKAKLEIRQFVFLHYWMAGPRVEDGHQAAFRFEAEKRLPLIKSPVLLLSGDKDSLYGRLEATKALISRCWTKIVKDGTSRINMEMPEVVAHNILEFLGERRI